MAAIHLCSLSIYRHTVSWSFPRVSAEWRVGDSYPVLRMRLADEHAFQLLVETLHAASQRRDQRWQGSKGDGDGLSLTTCKQIKWNSDVQRQQITGSLYRSLAFHSPCFLLLWGDCHNFSAKTKCRRNESSSTLKLQLQNMCYVHYTAKILTDAGPY